MFVNGKLVDIKNRRDLEEILAEQGFDYPDEAIDTAFRVSSPLGAVEGLLGDDKSEQTRAIVDLGQELENIVERLYSNSRKGNTKADIAKDIISIIDNLYEVSAWCNIYELKELIKR